MDTTTIIQSSVSILLAILGLTGIFYQHRKRNDLLEEESEETIKADGSTHKKSKKRYK